MKCIISLFLIFSSISAMAGGRTNAAIPIAIDLIQGGSAGFLIYGEFGNVGNCSVSNKVFVELGHPQYNQIYSSALAAFMAGKKIAFHAHACKPVPWFTSENITYNTVETSGAIYLSN